MEALAGSRKKKGNIHTGSINEPVVIFKCEQRVLQFPEIKLQKACDDIDIRLIRKRFNLICVILLH